MTADSSRVDWRTLQIEPIGGKDSGPCEHCGNMTRTVWGYVHAGEETIAAYFVQWTPGRPDHGANFDLILGDWDASAPTRGRQAIALEYRPGGFMVIDAAGRPIADGTLAEVALSRSQVVGQPIAEVAFAVADAIFVNEPQIDEIRQWQ